jgi:hypothetical protein
LNKDKEQSFHINDNHINIYWDFEEMSETIRIVEKMGNRERHCSNAVKYFYDSELFYSRENARKIRW